MIVCKENPKESISKLETIIMFSKILGYKINIQQSITFLYNTMNMWKQIKNIIPLIITTKKMKSLDTQI